MGYRRDDEPYTKRHVIEGNRISGRSGIPSTNPPTMQAEGRKAIMRKKDRPLDSQASLPTDSQETQATTGSTRESEQLPPQAFEDILKWRHV